MWRLSEGRDVAPPDTPMASRRRRTKPLLLALAFVGALSVGAATATTASAATATVAVSAIGPPAPDDTTVDPGPATPTEDPEPVRLLLFWGDGCPHCEREQEFLDELEERWPDLVVEQYEVWYDTENRALFKATADALSFEARSVPTTIVGERVWVGFSDSIAEQIELTVGSLLGEVDPADAEAAADSTSIDVPGFGSVDVGDRSLVVATVLISFVDGVNPCSLWVLSVLLALVLHSRSRSRVLLVGSVFLLVTSLLYGLFIVGAYSALDYVDEATWIRLVIAAVAGVFGLIHLGDYFRTGGPSLSIPDSHKPGLYRRMRALAQSERSLPAVLAGTATLAVGVSLLETPCSAGLPLLWTDLLASNDVSAGGAVALFSLYLAIFLFDELVLFGAAVVTMRATKLQEHHGRVLKLVSGVLMVVLAATMLLAPEQLESLTGTLVVFGGAGLAVAAIIALDRVRSGHTPTRHAA